MEVDAISSGRPGAAAYSAPEMLQAYHAPYGPPVDVWSVGTVLFELYTDGREVFALPREPLPVPLSAEDVVLEACCHRLGNPPAHITTKERHPQARFAFVFPLPTICDSAFIYSWGDVMAFSPASVLERCLQWDPSGRSQADAILLALDRESPGPGLPGLHGEAPVWVGASEDGSTAPLGSVSGGDVLLVAAHGNPSAASQGGNMDEACDAHSRSLAPTEPWQTDSIPPHHVDSSV